MRSCPHLKECFRESINGENNFFEKERCTNDERWPKCQVFQDKRRNRNSISTMSQGIKTCDETGGQPRSSRRHRLDVIQSMLENSNECSGKTGLIHVCNLSLPVFNMYKDYVVKAGLIEISGIEDGEEIFQTTERGREFLRDYAHLQASSMCNPPQACPIDRSF